MHGRGQPDSVRLRALLVPRRIAHRRLRAFHEELLAVREIVKVRAQEVRAHEASLRHVLPESSVKALSWDDYVLSAVHGLPVLGLVDSLLDNSE